MIILGDTWREGTGVDEAEWVRVADPQTPDSSEACISAYNMWVQQQIGNPALQCLQPSDRDVYVGLCQAAQSGTLDGQEALDRWNTHGLQQCGRKICRDLYNEHVQNFPAHAQCLAPYEGLIVAECEKAHVFHTKTVDQALASIGDLMARACPPPSDEPPVPPTPPREPPPPMTVTPPPWDDAGPGGPSGAGESPPVAQTRLGRDFGPIIGIGLLVAGAATVYRVRRKTRRR